MDLSIMYFFKYLANEWADVTSLSSSGREFHRQLPLNFIDLCPRDTVSVQGESAL